MCCKQWYYSPANTRDPPLAVSARFPEPNIPNINLEKSDPQELKGLAAVTPCVTPERRLERISEFCLSYVPDVSGDASDTDSPSLLPAEARAERHRTTAATYPKPSVDRVTYKQSIGGVDESLTTSLRTLFRRPRFGSTSASERTTLRCPLEPFEWR